IERKVLRPDSAEELDVGVAIERPRRVWRGRLRRCLRIRIADPYPDPFLVLLVNLEREIHVRHRPDSAFLAVVRCPLTLELFDVVRLPETPEVHFRIGVDSRVDARSEALPAMFRRLRFDPRGHAAF